MNQPETIAFAPDGTLTEEVFVLHGCERDLPPDEVDRRLGEVQRAAVKVNARRAFWLFEVKRRALYVGFGFKSVADFAYVHHGIGRDLTYRLTRAAEACVRSPALRAAFEAREVELTKVDVLRKVLTGDDESDAVWVEMAKNRTRHQLERAVDRFLGLETDEVRKTLIFTSRQWQILEMALEKVERMAGGHVPLAEAIELMAADFVARPVDESEELVIERAASVAANQPDEAPSCASCTSATEAIETEEIPLADADEETLVDALDSIDDPVERDRVFRLWVLHRDGWMCQVPWCDARSELEVDHIESRARAPHLRWDPSNVVVACHLCHDLKTRGLLVFRRLDDGSLEVRRPSAWRQRPLPFDEGETR